MHLYEYKDTFAVHIMMDILFQEPGYEMHICLGRVETCNAEWS